MRVIITKRFEKEVSRLNNRQVSHQIAATILQVRDAEIIDQIGSLKRLKGVVAYRIRIGNYRIGVLIENDTVEFISIGHKKSSIVPFHRHFGNSINHQFKLIRCPVSAALFMASIIFISIKPSSPVAASGFCCKILSAKASICFIC